MAQATEMMRPAEVRVAVLVAAALTALPYRFGLPITGVLMRGVRAVVHERRPVS